MCLLVEIFLKATLYNFTFYKVVDDWGMGLLCWVVGEYSKNHKMISIFIWHIKD